MKLKQVRDVINSVSMLVKIGVQVKSILIRKSSLKSLKEAREAYLKAELAIETGEYKPFNERRVKLSEVIEMWLEVYRPTVKESTFATTKRILNDHVVKVLGNIYLDKLTVIQCQKAVNQWFRDAPGTYKKYIFIPVMQLTMLLS